MATLFGRVVGPPLGVLAGARRELGSEQVFDLGECRPPLIGALIGWLAEPIGALPVGMAGGLAVGVAIDSLLNRHFNGPFTTPDDASTTDHGATNDAAR